MSGCAKKGGRVCGAFCLLAVLLLFLGYWLFFPLLTLLHKSLSDHDGSFAGLKNFFTIMSTPGLSGAIRHTLFVGCIVMLITVMMAFTVAYGLARTRMAGSRAASLVCMLPLFAPSLFPAVGLIYLLGAQGVCRNLLFGHDLQGPIGIVLGSVMYCLPHAVLLCLTTLRSIDPNLYEAARTLGIGPWRRFCSITFPHARYGVISAGLVAFILTITDFGIPKVLGGDYSMLATEIYKQVLGMHNFSLGASVSLVLMLPALGAFFLDAWARKKQARMFAKSVDRPLERKTGRDFAFTLWVWCILCALMAVFGMVIWGSFISFWPYDFSFTLRNYDFSVMGGSAAPFLTSILLALGVAVMGPAVMFLGAYCVERCKLPAFFAGLYRIFSMIPMSVPGTVLGLAYIFAFNRADAWHDRIYGSLFLLVMNTTIHFYTVGHLTFAAALQKLNPEYEAVGFTSGVPRKVTFFRVIMPLSARSFLEVSSYMFVNAVTTISAVLFLYTPSIMPASVFMLQVNETGNTAAAAAAGAIIMVLAFAARLIYLLLEALWNRKRRY